MATLCTIPPELRIEILSRLPDLRSLAAAIFTSRAIYEAFTIARNDVMQRVLDAEVPLASITSELELLLPQDCVGALQDRSSSVRGEALNMLCLYHGFVSAWCRRFCEETLLELPCQARGPASPSERLRIQRAFYRFWALSRAVAASGVQQRTASVDSSFAKTYMLRYSLWEIAEITLIYRYIYSKPREWCFYCRTPQMNEVIRNWFWSDFGGPNSHTVSTLALLDLPMLYAVLFAPKSTLCTLEAYILRQLGRHRSWEDLFTADRANRDRDPAAFPPRCICTRRDMPTDEYDACLRATAEHVGTLSEAALRGGQVRYDLALWDDSRLARLGLFLPAV
ncbi:hypothetical protein FN846DRAFT_902353 [Sphaerosporella brunnea]|uniref:F-box domain-containing protein n=1 Tax=Sphaerosporella brunnea TaxID=1250544 RepID=A0A5J5FAE5_9PEZI|nr:hypothetical protein FN846DRAFT_902353 [Sphaerosporella brunnea]